MYGAHDAVPTSGCEAGRPRSTKPGNNFTQQCSSHGQEQHQSVRDWHTLSSAGWRSEYCCRVLAAEDCHQLPLSYPTDSTGHYISASVTNFYRTPVFSLWFINPWMVTWGYFIPPDCFTCCFCGKSLKFLQSLWWLFLILIMLQNCLEIILLTMWLFAIWRSETIGHQQEVTTYCAAYTLCFFQNKQQVYS